MADNVKKKKPAIKLLGTLEVQSDEAANRFRELVTRFDSTPWDVNVGPPENMDEDNFMPVVREMWMFGLEFESNGKTHYAKAYTAYALALAKAVIEIGKVAEAEEEYPEEVKPGTYAVIGLGIGMPEQVRTLGPFDDKTLKLFLHDRVFSQIVELLTPVSAIPQSKRETPRLILTVEDPVVISNYAFPRSVSTYIRDFKDGLLIAIGDQVVKDLENAPPELERANSRLTLAKARRVIAEGLAALKL